jgi:hypothetical protein
MSVQGDGTVLRRSSHTADRRNSFSESQLLLTEYAHDLPDIPALPETLLLLELLIQERCVDLREMTELVLADLGATMQIYRVASREFGDAESRPMRLEDCISQLGLDACLGIVSMHPLVRRPSQRAVADFWEHSTQIAEYSRKVAQELTDADPEAAYLTGLFHAIGSLPALLGWTASGSPDTAEQSLKLAQSWGLPSCVEELFSEMHASGCLYGWADIVRKAHRRAPRPSAACSFESKLPPRLLEDRLAPLEQAGSLLWR